jgi:hypothetical protein
MCYILKRKEVKVKFNEILGGIYSSLHTRTVSVSECYRGKNTRMVRVIGSLDDHSLPEGSFVTLHSEIGNNDHLPRTTVLTLYECSLLQYSAVILNKSGTVKNIVDGEMYICRVTSRLVKNKNKYDENQGYWLDGHIDVDIRLKSGIKYEQPALMKVCHDILKELDKRISKCQFFGFWESETFRKSKKKV